MSATMTNSTDGKRAEIIGFGEKDELLPCPSCGSKHTQSWYIGWESSSAFDSGYRGECCDCGLITAAYATEAEAIAAWNTRAAIEYDGWFYLPKPKERIVQYGAPKVEESEHGYKVTQPVEVIESVIRSWGDELDEYVMERVCEVWNRQVERTCRNIRSWDNHDFECSSCGYELYPEDGTYESDGTMNYCPNCGAKVVEE